jgi:hypothetical protein
MIKDFFWLDDRKNAENMYKKMFRINSLASINTLKNTNLIESLSAYLADVITLCKGNIDENIPKSLPEFLKFYYDECYSQLHEEKNLNTLKLSLSHGKKKKYSEDSYDDLEKMSGLIESHSQEIIKQWLKEKEYENHIADFTEISEQLMVLLRVYMTVCILKEIAFIRSKVNELHNAELLGSILKITGYFDLSKLSNLNFHENSSFIKVLLSRAGYTNVNKRWEQLNELKEEAQKIAEEIWCEGDQRLHNEVAKSIYQTLKTRHEKLKSDLEDKYLASRQSNNEFQKMDRPKQRMEAEKYAEKSIGTIIRKAIIPVAEKYDRVFGIKGVSKK